MEQSGNGHTYYCEPNLRKGCEWDYSNEFVDRFYRYIRQCEVDFTPAKASAEVEYQAAFHVYTRAEDEVERLTNLLADRDRVAGAAKTIWEAASDFAVADDKAEFRAALVTLCLAAGLAPSAILQD
jgi:hypothetical protein